MQVTLPRLCASRIIFRIPSTLAPSLGPNSPPSLAHFPPLLSAASSSFRLPSTLRQSCRVLRGAKFCTSSKSSLGASHTCRQQTQVNSSTNSSDPEVPTNGRITCALYNRSGQLTAEHKPLTKTEIAQQFDLRYRDLRDIDLKSEGNTRILIRPSTILLQFFDLCVIIQADEALLVNPTHRSTGQSVSSLHHDLERRLSGIQEAADVPELPYELRAVEAALVAVLSSLRHEFIQVRAAAEESAARLTLETGVAAVELGHVFEHSRHLGRLESKARLVRQTIRELLDTDEDLAAMYLSDTLAGHPHQVSDHQEAEYMLETYHRAADALAESVSSVMDVLRKKEMNFRSSLAVQRNQIMFLEARIAIHTLGLAAGTLVAGLFGMNLVNYMEDAAWGFPAITASCITLSIIFSLYGARRLRRIQSLRDVQLVRVQTR
ncbi:hypothetical protein B0A52_06655 [Exophiala mesophila]|uniref:Magnesium transporter n=1 Tax=Exophiala mesophila TaxID=212818 RepID=A0A438N1I4_EXOME|nr:hypothetical protein B0A52_06655 [Exophiala mesophila]